MSGPLIKRCPNDGREYPLDSPHAECENDFEPLQYWCREHSQGIEGYFPTPLCPECEALRIARERERERQQRRHKTQRALGPLLREGEIHEALALAHWLQAEFGEARDTVHKLEPLVRDWERLEASLARAAPSDPESWQDAQIRLQEMRKALRTAGCGHPRLDALADEFKARHAEELAHQGLQQRFVEHEAAGRRRAWLAAPAAVGGFGLLICALAALLELPETAFNAGAIVALSGLFGLLVHGLLHARHYRKAWLALIAACLIGLAAWLGGLSPARLGAAFFIGVADHPTLLLIPVIGLMVGFIYLHWRSAAVGLEPCPQCRRRRALALLRAETLGTEQRLVTARKAVRDWIGRKVDEQATQTPITVERKTEHYQCRYCGFTVSRFIERTR